MGAGWWASGWASAYGWPFVIAWAVWVIASIVLHELGHGFAAIYCGDRTPINRGHMTWNPVTHMGGFSLAMFAMVGIAWGAMPVNPGNFRGRYDDAIVSAAGPMVNAILTLLAMVVAGVCLGLGARNGSFNSISEAWNSGSVLGMACTIAWLGAALNMALLALNLLPVPPLDGSRIIAAFVPPYRNFVYSEQGALVSLVLFALIFFILGGKIFDIAFEAATKSIFVVARWI